MERSAVSLGPALEALGILSIGVVDRFSAPCLGEEEDGLLAKKGIFERSTSRGRSRRVAEKEEV